MHGEHGIFPGAMWLNMLTCETISVAAFLSTIDSVSAPCGLAHDYWDFGGGNHLQNMDATGMVLRGLCWVALVVCILNKSLDIDEMHILSAYGLVAAYLFLASLIAAWDVMDLDCPDADHTMSCSGDATFWMVPRNYCAAQIANNAGCKVDEPDRVQMCVRLGRAPLVNGALAAWFVRTLLPDALRVFLLVYYFMEKRTGSNGTGRSGASGAGTSDTSADTANANNDQTMTGTVSTSSRAMFQPPSAQPSSMLHERDTLLSRDDADVIRQSPHVRKRAASAYNIEF